MARKLVSRTAPFLPSKQAHALSPLGAKFHPPFLCFDGCGLTLNLSGIRILVKFGPKPAFLHPYHLSGREMAQVQPLTLTLDPKLIHFYAKVFIYV
jgi:hypothetical protein